MSTLIPAPKAFENPVEALEWFWAHAMFPREFAGHILMATAVRGKFKFNPIFGRANLSAEEISELLALTVAVTLKLSIMNKFDEFAERKSAYQDYLRSAQILSDMGASIPGPDSASMWAFLINGKNTKRKGPAKKKLREKIVARLIGFLEFTSGKETWASGEDRRAALFLNKSLGILATACRMTNDNPWAIDLGNQLLLPDSVRSILDASKKRHGDLAFAGKIFWTLASMVYPAKFEVTGVQN